MVVCLSKSGAHVIAIYSLHEELDTHLPTQWVRRGREYGLWGASFFQMPRGLFLPRIDRSGARVMVSSVHQQDCSGVIEDFWSS